jgi:pimeloyl-ACP methyl ester carboxylesterase
VPTALVALFLAWFAVMAVTPASTPPILGADGKPLPGSITELTSFKIGGYHQELLIRGHDVNNPVLLYLSGGPGQSDLAYPRALFDELEKNVTVVCWDQRGTGYSYPALDPTSTLTLHNAISNLIEVTNYLRERFHQDKIYILGESYGTVLGVRAVQQRPDLYYAFIGSGQMVNITETDRRLYQDMLNLSARNGDAAMAAKMHAYGEPPYKDLYAYTYVASYYDAIGEEYTPPAEYEEWGAASGFGPFGVMATEYNLVEKVNVLRGLFDVFSVLYPQLQDIDFRKDAMKFNVPVYVLDAEHELAARRDLATEWYNGLEAPKKQLFPLKNAGHAGAFEEFREFTRIMNEVVLPETYPGR